MRPSLPFLSVPLIIAALALAPIACESSGNLSPAQDGFLPDGAPAASLPDGGTVAAPFACAFDEQQTFTCADLTLAPPVWVSQCVDGDNCSSRVNGNDTVAGCARATAYANVTALTTTCAAWQAAGGSLPAIDSGAPPVCAPGAAAGFQPVWHAPRARSQACTKAQIDSYRQCLDDAATELAPASCAAWGASISATDQACVSCLLSKESDPEYGPLVQLPAETLVNVAGCVAMAEGKLDGSGCGGAYQADQECQRAACLPTCPTLTKAQVSAEGACEIQANKTTCATFGKPAECAGAIASGDAGTTAEVACFGGGASATPDALFEAVALAFCGTP
jgi:hypothetical protein